MSARPRRLATASIALAALVTSGLPGVVAPSAAAAAGASISGKVTGPAGIPLEGISVSAARVGDGPGGYASTDEDGRFTISGLAGASYVLQFSDYDGTYNDEYYDDAQLEADADAVTVAPNGTRSEINAQLQPWVPASPAVVSGPTMVCECGGGYTFNNPDYLEFVSRVVNWGFSGYPQSAGNTYHVSSTPALPADAVSINHYDDQGSLLLFTDKLVLGTTYTLVIQERSGSTVVASSPSFSYTPQRVGAPTRLEIHDSTGHRMDVFGDSQESFVAGDSYTLHFTGGWAEGTTFWNALNYFGPDGLTLAEGGKASAPWAGFTIPGDYTGKEVLLEFAGVAPDRLPLFFSTDRVTVVAGPNTPQLHVSPATIAGTSRVGSTLVARGGTSAAAPARAYQWLRDAKAITGATAAGYKLRTADAGRRITVRITATKAGYATSTVTSAAAAVTAYSSRKPTVTGTATVGKKLTATRGTWVAPGFSFSYQWLRGGKAISGATRTAYLLKAADKGKNVSVRVTARRSGFASVAVASAARAVR